jgi:5-methylcytosine-specific restriction enzyme A
MPPRQGRPAPCPTPGCPHLVPCPTHIKVPWAGSTREARLPPNWKRTRARILRRDRHRCQWVTEAGLCLAPATEVDHVDRLAGDADWNLRALCHPHHARKSGQEGARERNRRPLGG